MNRFRHHSSLVVVLVGCVVIASGTLADEAIRPTEEVPESARVVAEFMRHRRLPGIAVAVTKQGHVVFQAILGVADIENNVPVTDQTFFRFASVSKAMTAVVAMQMQQEGKLNLDVPVSDIWPDAPPAIQKATVRHLLSHQAGVRHYQNVAWQEPVRHYKSLQSRIADSFDDASLSEPRQSFRYSTFGYVLLGRILEIADPDSYSNIIRRRLFDPVEMTTARGDDIYALIPHRSGGYFLGIDNDLKRSAPFDPSGLLPGGGLGGTIVDLRRFAVAVMDGTLLSESTTETMWTEQTLIDGTATGYALGWNVGNINGQRDIYHTGSQPATSSLVYLCPNQNITICVLTNLEQVNCLPLARSLTTFHQ
jgi:CubicO group peptidase (beta-lactamase class C family)